MPSCAARVQLRSYDFHSHGVEVVEELDQNLPEVIGDSHQLQQVFLNILNNAYDAVRETGRPPRIEIATTAHGQLGRNFVSRQRTRNRAIPDRILIPFSPPKKWARERAWA